jgi:hypothetical protein
MTPKSSCARAAAESAILKPFISKLLLPLVVGKVCT